MNTLRKQPSRFPIPHRDLECLLVLALTACASLPAVKVPGPLEPAADESLSMTVAAKGVQIYECRAGKGVAAEHEWAFVAPEAELFDARGNRIGRHGAGPYWQANDGSRIVGAVKARLDAPVSNAVPWLLLATKSNGPDGSFSKVTSVQRVNTAGGLAPADGCSQASVGASARVQYTADYHFFTVR
jgi:hypothetical protein